MRIVVTGSAGFIGSHLCAELRDHGHHVLGIDRTTSGHDLRKPYDVQRALDSEPDCVIHLAAKVGRLFGEDDVTETIVDNAVMTALVAKECGKRGIRFVYASTSEVYGDNGDSECDEITGPFALPHNAYGLTKRHGEELAELYAPHELTILRFSMPYGPGLPAGRGRAAIINMLWQASFGQTIPVHVGAERAWCYVADTVRGVRMILEQTDGGVFNVGRDDNPTAMVDVARLACDLVDADPSLIQLVPAPSNQTVVKRLSTTRLQALGWKPEVDLADGMKLTLEWVRSLDEMGSPIAA